MCTPAIVTDSQHIQRIVDRIRSYVFSSDLSAAQIAEDAALDRNALRLIARPDWNPTLKTLRKLLTAIEGG